MAKSWRRSRWPVRLPFMLEATAGPRKWSACHAEHLHCRRRLGPSFPGSSRIVVRPRRRRGTTRNRGERPHDGSWQKAPSPLLLRYTDPLLPLSADAETFRLRAMEMGPAVLRLERFPVPGRELRAVDGDGAVFIQHRRVPFHRLRSAVLPLLLSISPVDEDQIRPRPSP